MKKIGQQYSPRSRSPTQQFFNNRLGGHISPKNNSRICDAPTAASSQVRHAGMLNAPLATSRQNRSKSIREALDSIKQRSVSKNKPVLRRLIPSVKTVDKSPETVDKLRSKSPASRPLANITGMTLNKTLSGFSKIKSTKDLIHPNPKPSKPEVADSTREAPKKSILQPPS